ncbi:MAG: LysR family transcriptional regulator [Pseudobacteriovorax sp.]|nr:LysR family transcriptional regulator [Pseudobacteriovorax sp.]
MYMDTIDWNLLKSFIYVVRKGSLSAAARALVSTQPTVGRHIEALENQFGLPLFTRSREGLIPTDYALNLFPEAEAMESAYGALMRRVSGDHPEEIGTVRISASEIIGGEVIPALLQKFLRRYPEIQVELSISNQIDNLLKRDSDIAIRMSSPRQEALIAKKVGISPVGLYAHKSYLNWAGIPKTLEGLKGYTIIGPDTDMLFIQTLKTLGIGLSREDFDIRVDNQLVQLELLRKGTGIGVMQEKLAAREKNLVRLLKDELSIPMPVWLVMHEDLRTSRRVRLLYDYFVEEMTRFVES